jgi:hypothetical protein
MAEAYCDCGMQLVIVLTLTIAACPPLLVPGVAGSDTRPVRGGPAVAQAKAQFRARLSPVPIDIAMQSAIAGSGTVTASLAGTRLTVSGKFADLKTPATVARIHVGLRGVRGPSILDLNVENATSGTIDGSFDLTPQQMDDLMQGRFYIQLHSTKAPDGNLWGWLLPQEGRK